MRVRVEVCLFVGKDDQEANMSMFDEILTQLKRLIAKMVAAATVADFYIGCMVNLKGRNGGAVA